MCIILQPAESVARLYKQALIALFLLYFSSFLAKSDSTMLQISNIITTSRVFPEHCKFFLGTRLDKIVQAKPNNGYAALLYCIKVAPHGNGGVMVG